MYLKNKEVYSFTKKVLDKCQKIPQRLNGLSYEISIEKEGGCSAELKILPIIFKTNSKGHSEIQI